MRMGLGSAHRSSAQDPPPVTTLGQGAGMTSVAPDVDLRALTLAGFEPSTGVMELRDRKNNTLRLQHQRGPDCTVARVVGRDKPVAVPLTDTMGREIVPPLAACVDRALQEPRWAPLADPLRQWVRALAAAAEVDLGGTSFLASSQAFQQSQQQVAFGAQHGWKGFAQNSAVAAPPMKPTTAADITSSGRLRAVAPGLDALTVHLADGHAARGFLRIADAHGRDLALQQTKFSLPPQFSVEFNAPGMEPMRNPVDAGLAKELSILISVLAERNEGTPAEKVGAQLQRALLKVM